MWPCGACHGASGSLTKYGLRRGTLYEEASYFTGRRYSRALRPASARGPRSERAGVWSEREMLKFLTKNGQPADAQGTAAASASPHKRNRDASAADDVDEPVRRSPRQSSDAKTPFSIAAPSSSSTAALSTSPSMPAIVSADSPTAPASELSPDVQALIEHLTDKPWRAALLPECRKAYFAALATKVASERRSKTVYPRPEHVFAAFNLTPLSEVRVVILGQDPYHGAHQAHGLAFSVCRGVAVPPSLKNIYTELETDVPGFKRPSHGNLEAWARQGVLMLNATLTVRAHEANSHEKWGWQTFTDSVVKVLNQRKEPIVFILWGGFAQKKGKIINRSKHHVIEAAHPSPLSVTKFRGCKCFSKANAALAKRGMQEIDWSLAP